MFLRILLIVFFSCSAISLTAQNYPPYLNNSCWRVIITGLVQFNRIAWYIPEKDTVIGSYTYKKYIDSAKNRTIGYFREDVPNKKVYRWDFGSERIVFDFSLKLGDTIKLLPYLPAIKHVVVAEDSIYISSTEKRRQLRLRGIDMNGNHWGGPDEYWTEGIGTLYHPLWDAWEMPSDPDYYLLCSYQNGIPVYNNKQILSGCTSHCYCINDCCPIPPVIGNSKEHIYKWFPNPFSTRSTYLSENELKNITLIVFNAYGQKVRQEIITSGYTANFNRGNLAPGIYFVQLIEGNSKPGISKLVILPN